MKFMTALCVFIVTLFISVFVAAFFGGIYGMFTLVCMFGSIFLYECEEIKEKITGEQNKKQ